MLISSQTYSLKILCVWLQLSLMPQTHEKELEKFDGAIQLFPEPGAGGPGVVVGVVGPSAGVVFVVIVAVVGVVTVFVLQGRGVLQSLCVSNPNLGL